MRLTRKGNVLEAANAAKKHFEQNREKFRPASYPFCSFSTDPRHGIVGTLKEYPTKRLAQRALDEHIARVNKISYRPMPTAKFADFAQNWEASVLSQHRDSTATNYRTHIRKHLVPFFGGYSMKDLNPEMVQQFVSGCAASAKTIENICITLQSLWTTARAWGYVAHDLMEGVVLPEVKRVQRFFFSQREIQQILAKAKEPQRTWYGLVADGSPVTETIYTHVISEDGRRIAAQLGSAIWGVLDPQRKNGSCTWR